MNTILDILKQNGISIPDNNTPDSEVASKIKQLFAEIAGIGITEIFNEASMVSDLGMDALDVVEFLMKLEMAFDLVLPDEIDEAFWGKEIPFFVPDKDKKETIKEKLDEIEERIALLRKDDAESGSDNSDDKYTTELDEDEIEVFAEEIDDAESELNTLKGEFEGLKEDAFEEFAEKIQGLEETVSILMGEDLLKGDATVGEMIALVEWLVKQDSEARC